MANVFLMLDTAGLERVPNVPIHNKKWTRMFFAIVRHQQQQLVFHNKRCVCVPVTHSVCVCVRERERERVGVRV